MARWTAARVLTPSGPSLGAVALLSSLLIGCTSADQPGAESAGTPSRTSEAPATATEPEPTETTVPTPSSPLPPDGTGTPGQATPPAAPERPVRFEARNAVRSIQVLAGRIGPREATSPSYRQAARYVERYFRHWSYDVRRQPLRVPAGNSWGVDVPAGRTWNVVATPPRFDPSEPFRIVGAHLDTVPQAPGAEDNASGVAVLLELARLASVEAPRLPVVFVAFGAEEPRGDGDALHHFGSRAMVARLGLAWQRNLRAMLSLDRVGVGTVVPVSSGGLEPPTVRRALVREADLLGIDTTVELNQSSDHWSFDKAGYRAARIGSTPYAAYHSAADRPGVVNPAQLRRVGTLAWSWLD